MNTADDGRILDGWVRIGHLTGEPPWATYFKPLATPGEIENCVECGRHGGICPKGMDLDHMREFHEVHSLHTLPATGPGEVPPTQRNQSRQE